MNLFRKGYKSHHWNSRNGGTGVTNFSPEDKLVYLLAIREARMQDTMFVSDQPVSGTLFCGYSLHHTERSDLGPFWAVFEDMRAVGVEEWLSKIDEPKDSVVNVVVDIHISISESKD